MRTPIFGLTLAGFTLAMLGCSSESDAGGEPESRTVDSKSAAIRAAVQSNESVAVKLPR